MISKFTPPGIKIVQVKSLQVGRVWTTRGMVLCRHPITREIEAHVLLEEMPPVYGKFGERGYPLDYFELADLSPKNLRREASRDLELVE